MHETFDRLDDALTRTLSLVTARAEPPPETEVLRDLSIRMRKLKRASRRPQSLGFFGPSQAGKSFLVGALLSHELGSLEVLGRDGAVDFLKEINPAKGVESTGVVSRFSTAPAPAPLVRGDFRCELLSLEVVIEALATGFLVECTSPGVSHDSVSQVIAEARIQVGPPAPAVYRQAWETVWHNLLKKYQDRHPYLNELKRHPELRAEGWKEGVRSQSGWVHIYSLLWGGTAYARDLDSLARTLIMGLEQLAHAEFVEVGLEHVRASSTNPSLIDAACLNSIGTPQSPVEVYDPTAARGVMVEPAVLSALIAEIRLPLRPVQGSLLQNTDLLDFPGGRALKGINGFGPAELNTGRFENAIEVYKRGKLTFLFEQFSLDREITALVICSPGPTKPEAVQMQTQIERWLQIRYGKPSPAEAAELDRPSLFMALTKFDMSLGALRSDNAKARWESRVGEACVEFWARNHRSWMVNWGAEGRRFNNMFWICNPYADQMLALKPGTPDYEAVKRGYHESHAVRAHIAAYAEKWAAMEGYDDNGLPRSGVPLLSGHLRAKLAENIKERELLAEARTIRAELHDALRMLTPSRDEAEERAKLEEQAKSLVDALKGEMSRRYSGAVFGRFVDRLTVPLDELDHEIRTYYATIAPMSIKVSDKVKKLLVFVLKHWVRSVTLRMRDSELVLPVGPVDHFVRAVCTSKHIMPVLGKAIFPYFSRSEIDFPLVASILQVKITDSLLDLFVARPRGTPAPPIRLSYAETVSATVEDADEVDWGDVDFESEEEEESVESVDIVFAGNRYFGAWSEGLGPYYLRAKGKGQKGALDDPETKQLIALLNQVEGVQV